jgi:hypothetical protein
MINETQGILIFPAERIPWERFGGTIGAGAAPEDLKKYGRIENGKLTADLWIYGCATYDFGHPDTVHQTGFVYRIAQLIKRPGMGDAMSFTVDLDDVISKDELMMFPSPSADGITN